MTTDKELPAIPSLPEPAWSDVGRIPIHASDEPLVPASLAPERLCVYPSYFKQRIPNALPECYVRESVLERLLKVAECLPDGIRLVLLDAWRPHKVQEYLFETLHNALQHRFPELPDERLLEITRQFVSLPSLRPEAPSPHLTGGAVDVTMCDDRGRLLDMGTDFDEATPWSYTASFEQLAASDGRQRQVIHNRRMLYQAMAKAGFTNLPNEWWHYDFGNQLWACYHGLPAARFGLAEVVSLESHWKRQVERYFE